MDRGAPAAILSPSCPLAVGAAMQASVGRCCVTLVGGGFLWLSFTLKVPREIEDDQNRMAIEAQVAMLLSLWGLRVCGGCGQVESQKCPVPLTGEQETPRGWVRSWLDPLAHREAAFPPISVKARKTANTA